MKVEVRLFAAARELIGQSVCVVDLPEAATVADLRRHLNRNWPKLESMANVLFVAVNNQYSEDSRVLNENDSIACFPPVSGG